MTSTVEQHEGELQVIFEMTQARESQLVTAMSKASLEHEDRLAQASQLIDQYRSVLFKLREACKTGVEVDFATSVTVLLTKSRLTTLIKSVSKLYATA